MPEPEILKVPPVEAIEHFPAKGFHAGFDWCDTDAAEHLRSFTVAKAMQEDILQDIRGAVDAALAKGQSFGQFQAGLKPLLQAKGWWDRKTMLDPLTGKAHKVQFGSPRRLRIIYDTNLRMAYARGRWERIERLAEASPWLRYVSVLDERTRPDHAAWHGTVLRWDDSWWETHYPPNGWRCRCIVQQLSDDDLQAFGFDPSPGPPPGSTETRPWTNKRTGKVYQVPAGIDPGFQHNIGKLGRAAPLRPPDPKAMPELDLADATREKLSGARGSNPGGTFLGADGITRYVKFYDDPAQAYGEAIANRAYRELGLDAPISVLVRGDGKIVGIASELVENVSTLGTARRLTKGRVQAVLRGYAADVWLANWDAVGSGLDNVVALASPGSTRAAPSCSARARGENRARPWARSLSGRASPTRTSIGTTSASSTRPAVSGGDELGRKALSQIAAIRKLGARTRDFENLVPEVAGIKTADHAAILEALRTRAKLLHGEIAPRVRQALRDKAAADKGLPDFEVRLRDKMGRAYETFRRDALRKAGSTTRHGMTDPELTSIYAYTTEDKRWNYHRVNPGLRSKDPARVADVRDYRDTIAAGIARLPDHVGLVKRGTNLPADVLAEHQVDNVVTYKAFTSTSTGHGFDKDHRFVIHS